MNTEYKNVTKWFWAWQDEKEEAWLAAMSSEGYHLETVSLPGRYEFRKGKPANITYRLDYQSLRAKDKDSYQQLFADAGWEHVAEMGGWVYFRYKVINSEAPEIYSDLDSKIGKYQRVLTYLVVIMPLFIIMMPTISTTERNGPFVSVVEGLIFLLMVFLGYGIIQLLRRINQLKQNG